VDTRLDLLLLAALARGPKHGYGVLQELRRRHDETPESLIHPALRRLERAGLVTSRRGRERVYRLSPHGRRRLEGERRLWFGLARAVTASH
jgi:PadR family transcriptional regulator, regulatory protein PadR